MSNKDDKGRNAAIHHGERDNKSGANDPKAAVHKPKTNGDGHPRGR